MKTATLGIFAAILLFALPAYAAKEFDCPPTQEVQSQKNETALSEDLVEKRKQAREADLARLKERFMRSAAAQPVANAGQSSAR